MVYFYNYDFYRLWRVYTYHAYGQIFSLNYVYIRSYSQLLFSRGADVVSKNESCWKSIIYDASAPAWAATTVRWVSRGFILDDRGDASAVYPQARSADNEADEASFWRAKEKDW